MMENRSGGRKNPLKPKTTKKPVEEELFRLNKYIANSGVCARREADELISRGLIYVNGKKVTDLGIKVKLTDKVEYQGKSLVPGKKVYLLLNKPKGYVTTVKDPHAKLTVLDLVKDATKERIYPVGRLDKSTTGVLLLTNDGDLAGKLTHPKYGSYPEPEDKTQVGVEIHSGQNRVVRRIFEKFGYSVQKLDRVFFAGLTKKNLQRGSWRHLTDKEVSMLKRGIFK